MKLFTAATVRTPKSSFITPLFLFSLNLEGAEFESELNHVLFW
jgi:hypothetical protein